MVDEGRMLLNGQAQGSSGLNSNPIKVEAEVEVREQSASDVVESVLLLPSSFFLHINYVSLSFDFCCYHLSYY